jgi:hypothetical protein
LILDAKPDPGSSEANGSVADVIGLGHEERESSGRSCLRPMRTSTLFDREDERGRICLEDSVIDAAMRRRRAEQCLVKHDGVGGVVNAQANMRFWQPHDESPRPMRAGCGQITTETLENVERAKWIVDIRRPETPKAASGLPRAAFAARSR